MAVKGGAGGGERNFISPVAVQENKLPAFFYRLSPIAQRRYLRSDSIDRYELEMTPAIGAGVSDLLARLGTNQPKTVTPGAQAVVTELCRQLRVTPPIVEVRGVRPHSSSRELHGIFYPDARPPRMVVWMRTARRHDLVRARTFVRTLAHELGHYLDYALLNIGDSYHCRGFFRRESFLTRLLMPADIPTPQASLDSFRTRQIES